MNVVFYVITLWYLLHHDRVYVFQGFDAAECSNKNESCRLELERELEQYDTAISAISEQLEKSLISI